MTRPALPRRALQEIAVVVDGINVGVARRRNLCPPKKSKGVIEKVKIRIAAWESEVILAHDDAGCARLHLNYLGAERLVNSDDGVKIPVELK